MAGKEEIEQGRLRSKGWTDSHWKQQQRALPPHTLPGNHPQHERRNLPLSCLAMTNRQTRMFSQVDYTPLAMSNDLKKMGNRIATHKK
jgi:hypothetical protein